MTKVSGKIAMAKLARISERRAELNAELAQLEAERAKIERSLADGEVDPRTLRRAPRAAAPVLPQVSEVDRARARQALRESALRRRVG